MHNDHTTSSESRSCQVAARASVVILDSAFVLTPQALGDLERLAHAALGVLGAMGEVRVRIVGDAEMAQAHQRYSNTPGTTDVLTFDLAEGASRTVGTRPDMSVAAPLAPAPLDVDILVCIDEARRQGVSRGHAPERELLLYILHGVLHCLGHDDHDDEAFARMHSEEDRVLSAIGIGPVFATPERGA